MNKIILFSIFLFSCLQAHSSPRSYKSFICPDNNYSYKGITCCLESLTRQQCEDIVDQMIPEKVLSDIQTVQTKYAQSQYDFGQVPNCFWNSLNFSNLYSLEEPKPQTAEDLLDSIERANYVTVDEKNKNYGDLIAFEGIGQTREDIMENGVPKKVWFPYTELIHAAIFLKNDLVFQKENIGTDVFTITSLKHTIKAYRDSFNSLPVRGEVEATFYQKPSTNQKD